MNVSPNGDDLCCELRSPFFVRYLYVTFVCSVSVLFLLFSLQFAHLYAIINNKYEL